MQELSERQRSILKLVVAEHVSTTQPVSSEAVSRKLSMSVSPATVRNEMSALEEGGYLYHPHTSAGRLPTEKGYRYFVETLLEARELAFETQQSIRERLRRRGPDPDEWVDVAAEELASAARNAALVSAPRAQESRLKHLQLVCVNDFLSLLVVVLSDSTLRQQFLSFAEFVSQDEATRMANHLNARFAGMSAAQIQASEEPLSGHEGQLVDALLRIMRQVDERRYWDVHYDGLQYMLAQPEFERVERMRQVLDLLTEKRALAEVFVSAHVEDRPLVIIGSAENSSFPLRECSLVVGRYGEDGEVSGVLAVLGPMRMEYERAISSVRYLASLLNELLAELYGWKR